VFKSFRSKGFSPIAATALAALTAAAPYAAAQTAPQLLPYTAKVLAGGASAGPSNTGGTATTVGASCQRTVTTATGTAVTSSGFTSYNAIGDGCLATEVTLSAGTSGPRYAITDASGAVYFSDYYNYSVRRIDPVTGVVTTIVGGGTNATAGGSCGTKDATHTVLANDKFGDGCLGTSVALGKPTALAFATIPGSTATGDLFFSDTYNYNVRRMSMTNGGVAAVVLTSGGSGYTAPPTVTFSAPASGTAAIGTAVINSSGIVTRVTITSAGSGYTPGTMPTVTFSASQGGLTATGTAVYTGVMSIVAGSYNGGSTSAKGYSAGCNASAPASATLGTTCLLDAPYGISFDTLGNLYIAEEYYEAILALNLGTTASTIYPTGGSPITLAPGILTGIAGARTPTSGTTTGNSGCNYANYVNGMEATLNYLDAPYGVALDSSGNIYVADEFNNAVAEINPSTGYLNNFTGLYPGSGTGTVNAATKRGPVGFTVGSDFGIALDPANNFYQTDSLAGYIWRVDSPTQTMYTVGGGGAATIAGSACPSSSFTATDAFGDGCPAVQANYSKSCAGTAGCPTNGYSSTGIFGVFADAYGDVFTGDEGNGLVREIASGTQFGATGATATDYIDIHFAAGDTPLITPAPTASTYTIAAPSTAFVVTTAIPANSTVFALGTASCTVNTDNNGTSNTTDCVVPVTASPTVSGQYTGTLSVKSAYVTTATSFALSGNFVQSPITRVALTSAGIVGCGGSTYATVTSVILTASLTANGPNNPSGNIVFTATSGGVVTTLGTIAVGNIGTPAVPVYGAKLPYTFATAGTYTVTATYSGDTVAPIYFLGSANSTTLISRAATFRLANTGYQQASVTPGQTALYSFLISQGNYTGTIGFTVTGLPANSSYTISPTTVTGIGCVATNTVALSILTQAQQVVTPGGLDGSGHGLFRALSLLSGLGLALLIGLRRRRLPMRFAQIGMMLALFLMAGSTLGCGKAIGTVLQPATPASPVGAPYTITVTPTTTVGTAPAPVTFSLTVL
jgi:hypothetical protein